MTSELLPGLTLMVLLGLTAGLQHTDLQATGSWGGLPAAADGSQLGLPRSTYLGTPWNTWDRHNQQAFAELEHRLDSGWQLKAQARSEEHTSELQSPCNL